MLQTRLNIKNDDGETLVCIEVRPDETPSGGLPVVILCHGFAYNKEEDGIHTGTAEVLATRGYAAYYFDFSGCGESEGDYSLTTLTKLIADLKAVHAAVAKLPYTNNNVSLIGQSFGTNVVIAAQLLDIQRMVLCGSFADPHKILSALFPNFDEQGISERRGSTGLTKIGPQFWNDLQNFNLAESIANYGCPILFIHGGQDLIVPLENMKPLLAAAKNPVEPVILERSDHGLMPQIDEAIAAVDRFFAVE